MPEIDDDCVGPFADISICKGEYLRIKIAAHFLTRIAANNAG